MPAVYHRCLTWVKRMLVCLTYDENVCYLSGFSKWIFIESLHFAVDFIQSCGGDTSELIDCLKSIIKKSFTEAAATHVNILHETIGHSDFASLRATVGMLSLASDFQIGQIQAGRYTRHEVKRAIAWITSKTVPDWSFSLAMLCKEVDTVCQWYANRNHASIFLIEDGCKTVVHTVIKSGIANAMRRETQHNVPVELIGQHCTALVDVILMTAQFCRQAGKEQIPDGAESWY